MAESTDGPHRGALHRVFGRQAGTAVVEFALVVPVLLLIVFGLLDFGRALNYLNDSTNLARSGARWAIVDKPFSELDRWDDTPCTDSLQQCIKDNGGTQEMRNATRVCVDFLGNTDPQVGDPVRVTTEVSFDWLVLEGFKFLPWFDALSLPGSFEGSAVMRLEQPPTEFSEGCTP